ncbi:hypothetical protein L1O59_004997 [Salmonella enterica]|nr:hypothetical protein [Salmonella enterica]
MNSFVKALFNNSTEQLDPRYLKKDQNLADVPDKAAGRASLDVYSKTESNENYMAKSQNGADIPDKPKFIQNVGLKETVERATNAVQKTGDTMTGSLYLKSSDNVSFAILNEDGNARVVIYKIKDGDGIHINNGPGTEEFVLSNDGRFYAARKVHAGGSKKLAIQSDNNSAVNATFNLWGDANRPTVIELDDDQGWHLFSQRNPDGSILFIANGEIKANTLLHAGDATIATDGNVNGSVWGGWLNDWINNNFVREVRRGSITSISTPGGSGGESRTYTAPAGSFICGITNYSNNTYITISAIKIAPIQARLNGNWVTIGG